MSSTTAQSGVEPPSGLKGAGDSSQPYDLGNAPETTTQPGIEPPSAKGGEGTVESPFDSGNKPEQANVSSTDPPSAPSQTPIGTSTDSPPAASQAEKSTSEAADTADPDASKQGAGKAKARVHSLDRDVSPGTMADGSHATTSGDRGENYEPSTMSKLKNKLHFGGGKK